VREDPGNYRPVSLTSAPGKITEQIILGTIERHLKNSATIRHRQHGFTKGKSCLTNLISFYGKVTCLGDEGKVVAVISLDFRKAFDAVPHSMINGIKFNKNKCQILFLGQSNIGHKYKLGEKQLESSPAEKAGGAGWQQAQCEPAAGPGSREGKPLHPGVHQTQPSQPVKKGDCSAIFSVGAASP